MTERVTPTETKVGDGFDLPKSLPPATPYPQDADPDTRMEWLMKIGVALSRAGSNFNNSPELLAIEQEQLRIQNTEMLRAIVDLTVERSELIGKLNHLEREKIDIGADELLENAKDFIEFEVARQVKELELKVTRKAIGGSVDTSALDKLQMTKELLCQRMSQLEQLNPIWAKIHTKS